MDANRKKELLQAYKDRRPEMGVICCHCTATGETFYGISTDTRADFNSNQAKLSMNSHPNKRMQQLWREHGASGLAWTVAKVLKYEDPLADYTEKLEQLREACLAADENAKKIWR